MIVYKTSAAGNTFVHVEKGEAEAWSREDLVRSICHPLEGFNADGVVFYRQNGEGADFSIFNRDGSAAEISGNGMAGLAAVILARGFSGNVMHLSSQVGKRCIRLLQRDGFIFCLEVEVGAADFSDRRLFPFLEEGRAGYEFSGIRFHPVSMGNPHAVVILDEWPDERKLIDTGRILEGAPVFPLRTNVELVFFHSHDQCRIFYYERGVGPTLSSGSGSAAVFAVLRRLGKVTDRLAIHAPGGRIGVSGTEAIFIETVVRLLWKGEYFL